MILRWRDEIFNVYVIKACTTICLNDIYIYIYIYIYIPDMAILNDSSLLNISVLINEVINCVTMGYNKY